MLIEDYFAQIDMTLTNVPFVQSIELLKEKRSDYAGLAKGILIFQNGSRFHLMEFVNLRASPRKKKYRYHFVEKNSNLIFRYDNAPHHKESKTFPHHKHLSDGTVVDAKETDLQSVINEIALYHLP